jgi:uncharacterized protein
METMGARPSRLLNARFLAFIDEDHFPCVGAKAALSRGALRTAEFSTLGDPTNDLSLLAALQDFAVMIAAGDYPETTVHSFAALFHAPLGTGELRFENLLWHQLWRLHLLDAMRGVRLAGDVSSDTGSAKFSLSLAGHPFFVIGLHPGASRIARRFRHPALVFNSHRQFEKLRADGRYGRMQQATRRRDRALQGSVDVATGAIEVRPPRSRPGDYVRLRAEMPLVVALTACSAGQSNNFRFKPIDYCIERSAPLAPNIA